MNIIFNGPPGSGKDEACSYLVENHGFKHLSFKDQLFFDVFEYYNVEESWFMSGYNDRKLKEAPEELLGGISRRQAMIHVSENFMKPLHGKDHYGKITAERMLPGADYCFSDGGFSNELLPVINKSVTGSTFIVQILRDGCNFDLDSRNYINGVLQERITVGTKTDISLPSEIILPIRMYQIDNNGTKSDFHQSIKRIIGKEANVQETEKDILRKSL